MSDDPMKNYFLHLSAFQKCVRRGMEREAYYFASKVEDVNPKSLWNRIKIIASEDVGPANPTLPQTIDVLEKWYWEQIRAGNSGGRLHLINAILQLVRSPKCRDCDNLLIAMDVLMFGGFKIEIPDFAYDKHTAEGRKMGRGFEHFFAVGTICENDQSNPIYKEEAKELLVKNGSPVKWKMDKLAKFKGKEKDPQTTLEDSFT